LIALALLLLGVGLVDAAGGGLQGIPRRSWGTVAHVVLGSALVAVAYLALGASGSHAAVLGGAVLVGAGAWTALRIARRHALALLAVASTVLLAVVGSPLFGDDASLDFLVPYTAPSPWYGNDATRLELHALIGSVLVFLSSTSNGVVRSVLLIASDESAIRRSESRLRGGRMIGPLERWLIFGLALAGQPTAAALVISAKSIVRFPELSARGRPPGGTPQAPPSEADSGARAGSATALNETDEITEYFLLGSLSSWTLALAPTVLLLSAGSPAPQPPVPDAASTLASSAVESPAHPDNGARGFDGGAGGP